MGLEVMLHLMTSSQLLILSKITFIHRVTPTSRAQQYLIPCLLPLVIQGSANFLRHLSSCSRPQCFPLNLSHRYNIVFWFCFQGSAIMNWDMFPLFYSLQEFVKYDMISWKLVEHRKNLGVVFKRYSYKCKYICIPIHLYRYMNVCIYEVW